MTENNGNNDEPAGDGEGDGRPGGPPDRTLAAERIAQLESQIGELQEAIKAGNAQAAEHKGAKRTTEEQVQQLIDAQEKTRTELRLAKIETAATKIGAKDPDLVAQLVSGSDNYLADIERLKTDKPYLFGAPGRAAGADMSSGDGGNSNGLDDLDKHLADKYGTRT